MKKIYFLLLPPILALCLTIYGQGSGSPVSFCWDFETHECDENECAFGTIREGCYSTWATSNNSPNMIRLSSTVTSGEWAVRLAYGLNTAGEGLYFTIDDVNTTLPALLPGKTYRLSFMVAGNNTTPAFDPNVPHLEIWATSGLTDNTACTTAFPPSPPSGSIKLQDRSLLSMNAWNNWSYQEIIFTVPSSGLDQIWFFPNCNPSGSFSACNVSWLIDDVCYEEYDPNAACPGHQVYDECFPAPFTPDFDYIINQDFNVTFVDETLPFSTEYKYFHWNFGDGTTVAGEGFNVVNHDFPEYGVYQVCMTVIDDNSCCDQHCEMVVIEEPPVDPCSCGDTPLIVGSGQSLFLNSAMEFRNSIHVKPGASLTVASDVKMAPGCKIQIERGAKFNLWGGTLKSNCLGQKWKGIEVWGNSEIPHPSVLTPSYPNFAHESGVVRTLDGEIWHAEVGIHGDAFGNPNPPYGVWGHHWGGIVRADGTLFKECGRAAHFAKFPFTGMGTSISRFTNCTFEDNEILAVSIWDQDDILFSNCVFKNNGRAGVHGLNYSARIVNNDFEGFMTYGVEAENTPGHVNATTFSVVPDNVFSTAVSWGVQTKELTDFVISDNTFNSGVGTYNARGLDYKIDYNSFDNLLVGTALIESRLGLADSECNSYTGQLATGLQVMGSNGTFLFRKEEFNLPDREDMRVLQFNDGAGTTILGRIGLFQREPNGNPVVNVFSGLDNIRALPAEAARFIYYHPSDLITLNHPEFIPRCDANGANCTPPGPLNVFTNDGDNNVNANQLNADCLNIPGIGREGESIDPPAPCIESACIKQVTEELDDLKNEILFKGETDQLLGELMWLERRYGQSMVEFVGHHLSNASYDSIEQTLSQDASELAYVLRVESKVVQGDYSGAKVLIDNMPVFDANTADYQTIQVTYVDFLENPQNFSLSENEIATLIAIAQTRTKYSWAAQSLLSFFEGMDYTPYLPDPSSDMVIYEGDELRTTGATFLVRPVPASNDVYIHITEDWGELSDCEIEIISTTGEVVMRHKPMSYVNQLDVAELTNNVYIIQLRNTITSKKAVNKLILNR